MKFNFNECFETMMQSHDLDTVIILAHMNPDGDAAGSVMGLTHYIQDVYPQYRVLPYLASTLDKGPGKLVADDTMFAPYVLPDAERYGVIVCDTATKERMIGLELYEKAIASIVMDHHASNEGYGDVNYTQISEACAENIFHSLDWERWSALDSEICRSKEIHPTAPDYFYLGILHDTGGFVRAQESTMDAAHKLLQLGVVHKYIMKTMQNTTLEVLQKRSTLLSLAIRAIDGKVSYLFIDRKQAEELGIEYEDIHPISGFLRECEDMQLGFTMYEEIPGTWRCSFRSDGKWVNVNELLKPFGGGGHAAASGLRKQTDDPKKLLEDILQRIDEMRVD